MGNKLISLVRRCLIILCVSILIACQYRSSDSVTTAETPTALYSLSESQATSSAEPTSSTATSSPSQTGAVSHAPTVTVTSVQSSVLPTVTTPKVYVDPTLRFRLTYPETWQLEVHDGTSINDGSGHTIILKNSGYEIWLQAQFSPDEVGDCSGRLSDDLASSVWKYEVDGIELWRVKAEAGNFNSYNGIDKHKTYTTIISPISIRGSDLPDAFTCSLEVSNKIFSITYRFPVSSETLKAGDHDKQIVAEVDYILASIKWDVPRDKKVPPVTLVPPHPTSEVDKDLTSPDVVLKWFQRGLQEDDISVFKHLASDQIGTGLYRTDATGLLTKAEFLQAIERRLASEPTCDGYQFRDDVIDVIWIYTSNWEPAWDFVSTTTFHRAAFELQSRREAEYRLIGVYLHSEPSWQGDEPCP